MLLDIPVALEALGILYTTRSNEANSLCPQHYARTGQEDHSPSWYINLETGQHICFSCGYKGNLAQLVCDINEFYKKGWQDDYTYDYEAAQGWLATVSSIPLDQLVDLLKKIPERQEPSPKPLQMSEARLAVFEVPPTEELEKRHVSIEAAEKYGVLWDAKKANWILPLREPHFNKLIGWQEKGTIHRTFFNRPTGLQKSKTLFGIENQNESMAIVVESPLDCLRLVSAGFDGAVATCGSVVSEEQIKLLRFSDKIISAFDNDQAGKKASKLMLEFGRKYGLNLFFFNYGSSSAKDPGDLTDDEIAWGIANAISAILGEQAYV